MKRISVFIISFLGMVAVPVFAASPLLAYFKNSSGGLRLEGPGGATIKGKDLKFGLAISSGTTIVTENSDFAEIALPNGSIIKIQENTNFTIVRLSGENGSKENTFDLQVGRFRTIAAKMSSDETYVFRTRSAVCGVRGTDTGAESLIDPETKGFLPSKIFVFDGVVDVTKLDEAGNALETVALGAGQWIDTGADVFAPLAMNRALAEQFRRGLDFEKLDPSKVPGHKVADTDAPPPDTDTALKPEPEATPEEPDWVKTLREIIGMEIGAVTIGDETYAKAVLAPKFTIGKLRLSLYLPIIYQTNLFDPSDWYRPDGNNEWSFGTDPSFGDDWWLRVGDIFYDLVLKIKGLEYGNQRDDFFIRLGNLNTFTVGHGMIMRNYANDADFPGMRRVGFNLGVDTGPFGFELVSNDLGMAVKGEPEILGTRIFFRPAHPFPLALGLTLLADLDPAKDVPSVGDPIFFNLGVDLDFPLVETDALTLVLFTDAALMLPYFREDVGGIPSGFAFDAIIHGPSGETSFKNYGIAAGLLGSVSMFNWRLEGRYYTGEYKPAVYNAGYDRVKLDYVYEVIDYLQNPGADRNQISTFGVYGEGELTFEKIFSVTLGYFAPLAFTPDGLEYGTDDYFQIKFTLEPKVIPVVGIFGSISYERTNFVSSFAGGFPELFDEHTVVRTTIGYPVAEGLQILFHYTTTRALDPGSGTYDLVHAFTFETVIDF